MAPPDLLRTENIRKEFGGLVAVSELDFTIPERSLVSLIGPNGAGKTTFFNMLTGVYTPTGGRIVFDENVELAPPGQSEVGQDARSAETTDEARDL